MVNQLKTSVYRVPEKELALVSHSERLWPFGNLFPQLYALPYNNMHQVTPLAVCQMTRLKTTLSLGALTPTATECNSEKMCITNSDVGYY